MNRTILLAIGGLALGLALSTIGTLLLGAARAVAKHVSSTNNRMAADLRQYAAALLALIGFLVTAGGGALLTRQLAPLSGSTRTIAAAGVGFLLFAAIGVIFSKIADMAEEAKTRRLPAPVYKSTQTPSQVSGPVSGPPGGNRPVSGSPSSGVPAGNRPVSGSPSSGPPAGARPTSGPPAGAPPVSGPPASAQPTSGAPAGSPPVSGPPASAPPAASTPPARATGGGRHAKAEPDEATRQADLAEAAAGGSTISDGETLLRVVRPGWIYRDQSDHWYLGVVDGHTGGLPLLQLPDFSLVAVAEPAYPLVVAGAGEIAVVPLPPADPELPADPGSTPEPESAPEPATTAPPAAAPEPTTAAGPESTTAPAPTAAQAEAATPEPEAPAAPEPAAPEPAPAREPSAAPDPPPAAAPEPSAEQPAEPTTEPAPEVPAKPAAGAETSSAKPSTTA